MAEGTAMHYGKPVPLPERGEAEQSDPVSFEAPTEARQIPNEMDLLMQSVARLGKIAAELEVRLGPVVRPDTEGQDVPGEAARDKAPLANLLELQRQKVDGIMQQLASVRLRLEI